MIEFKNVSKVYENGTEALKDVNLKIDQGEFVFVVGASGAGKSTFLKLLMREETPTNGDIYVNDFHLPSLKRKEIPALRRTMGIVFQDFRLIPKMTVLDNIAFAMRVIGAREKEIRKKVPHALELVALSSKARSMPNELSGGQQQRVALARALVNKPKLIIADEPTGNVDPEMSYEIVDLLNRISQTGTTVIMVTHEHTLVDKFHHRKVVIENGCIVEDSKYGLNLRTEDSKYDYDRFSDEAAPVPPRAEPYKASYEVYQKMVGETPEPETEQPVDVLDFDAAAELAEAEEPTSSVQEVYEEILNSSADTYVNAEQTAIDYSIYLDNMMAEEKEEAGEVDAE